MEKHDDMKSRMEKMDKIGKIMTSLHLEIT